MALLLQKPNLSDCVQDPLPMESGINFFNLSEQLRKSLCSAGLKKQCLLSQIKALEHKVPIKLSSNAKHTYSSLPGYALAFPNYMAFALSGMSSCALLMYCDPTHILRLSEPPSSPLILGSRSHPKRALSVESVCTGSDRHVHVE